MFVAGDSGGVCNGEEKGMQNIRLTRGRNVDATKRDTKQVQAW